MVRHMPIIHVTASFSPIPLAIGLFVSIILLVTLCAKHAKNYKSKTRDPSTPKAPLPSPKQLIATISHKAMMVNAKKPSPVPESAAGADDSGVWQKAILMGERCQPPEFSGVIYYDYDGNRISEMPKSPRATSMSPLRSFTFPEHEKSIY